MTYQESVRRFDAQANELSRALNLIPAAMRADILAPAVGAAAEPIKSAMRRLAPKDTGALEASIDKKVISDAHKGTAAALVGPDRNYYRGGKALGKGDDRRGAARPANYAHLVEFGHVAVAPIKKTSRRKKTALEVGFVPPRPFIRPGFAAGEAEAQRILVREINVGIARIPVRKTL